VSLCVFRAASVAQDLVYKPKKSCFEVIHLIINGKLAESQNKLYRQINSSQPAQTGTRAVYIKFKLATLSQVSSSLVQQQFGNDGIKIGSQDPLVVFL
jgi:hypothetical protein